MTLRQEIQKDVDIILGALGNFEKFKQIRYIKNSEYEEFHIELKDLETKDKEFLYACFRKYKDKETYSVNFTTYNPKTKEYPKYKVSNVKDFQKKLYLIGITNRIKVSELLHSADLIYPLHINFNLQKNVEIEMINLRSGLRLEAEYEKEIQKGVSVTDKLVISEVLDHDTLETKIKVNVRFYANNKFNEVNKMLSFKEASKEISDNDFVDLDK